MAAVRLYLGLITKVYDPEVGLFHHYDAVATGTVDAVRVVNQVNAAPPVVVHAEIPESVEVDIVGAKVGMPCIISVNGDELVLIAFESVIVRECEPAGE